MPYLVNGQIVPEQVIREEFDRLARDPNWQTIHDANERNRRLQAAAESSACDRILIEQLATNDPRGIDPALVEQSLEQMKSQSGCRSGFDDALARLFLERDLRVQRFRGEMIADAPYLTAEEVESFYAANCSNFRQPELFRAAHIVKYVNQPEAAEPALAALQVALAELERGEPFSVVAARHSDCADKGGDLGEFPTGYMVEEFEQAIRTVEPGQRTGIFPTPFGFHIAMLIGRTPAGQAGLERVRVDIERVMKFAAQHEAFVRKVAELRSHADIRWVPGQQAAAS